LLTQVFRPHRRRRRELPFASLSLSRALSAENEKKQKHFGKQEVDGKTFFVFFFVE